MVVVSIDITSKSCSLESVYQIVQGVQEYSEYYQCMLKLESGKAVIYLLNVTHFVYNQLRRHHRFLFFALTFLTCKYNHLYVCIFFPLSSSIHFVRGEMLPATCSPPHLISLFKPSPVSCLLLSVVLLCCLPHISPNTVLPSQPWSPSSHPVLLT